MTYYSLYEQNNGQIDFNEYLLNEYQINEIQIMQYEEEHKYSVEKSVEKKKYYIKFVELISEIEKIKKKYNFDSNQGILAYIILNNISEKSIHPKNFMEKYTSGINIAGEYDLQITLSEKYKGEFIKYVDDDDTYENEYGGKGGYWKYDEDNLVAKLKEIINKLDVDLIVDKDVEYKYDDYSLRVLS